MHCRRQKSRGAAIASLGLLFAVGCTPTTPRAAPDAATPGAAAPVREPRVRFEVAGPGPLAPLVRAFSERARREGMTPLVYVGATWCEPCRYFHDAATRGGLDPALPPLALLELDLDRDGARIAEAGYASRMIPLFAVPGAEGRGTGLQIEGSIHGAGSPAEITPRLRALIARAAAP
ncbi:MAG: thioredoxin [Myxococcales bacterium]|nr:thioredoxin [Myxococcales bacterium]